MARRAKHTKQSNPAWREFEKLVARIEKAVAPEGAVVKSPDYVRDYVAGRMREVDASVRSRVGTAEVLITIECRRRGQRQDVVWIEQLKAKREAIRASRTIAVSSVGFSESAIRAASGYGIDLRRLAELSPEEVRTWILPQGLVHSYKKVSFNSVTYAFEATSGPLPPESRGHADARELQLISGGSLSLNDLWLKAQEQQDLYEGVPEDGSTVRRLVRLRFPPNTLGLHTPEGLRELRAIKIDAQLGWGLEEIALGDAEIAHYTSHDGLDVRRIEFVTKNATRGNVRLAMQVEGASTKATFVLEAVEPSTHRTES